MGSFDGVGHRLLSDAAVTRSTIQPTDRPTEHRASCLDPSSSRRRDVLVGADNTRKTTRSFATDSLLLTVELNHWNVSRQIYSRTCHYWIVWRKVFLKIMFTSGDIRIKVVGSQGALRGCRLPARHYAICIYKVAPKSKPPPIFQKIALKIANEIRFLRKVKVWIKHYNTICS